MENNQQITVTDLNELRNILDLASTRGAFRGAELSQVGELYNKLTSFLNAVIAQAKTQETSTDESNQQPGE